MADDGGEVDLGRLVIEPVEQVRDFGEVFGRAVGQEFVGLDVRDESGFADEDGEWRGGFFGRDELVLVAGWGRVGTIALGGDAAGSASQGGGVGGSDWGAAGTHGFSGGGGAAACPGILEDVCEDWEHLVDEDVAQAAFEGRFRLDGLVELIDDLAGEFVIGLRGDEHDAVEAVVCDHASGDLGRDAVGGAGFVIAEGIDGDGGNDDARRERGREHLGDHDSVRVFERVEFREETGACLGSVEDFGDPDGLTDVVG